MRVRKQRVARNRGSDLPAPSELPRATPFTRIVNACRRHLRTERAALRESEERYRRLVELSPDPIGVHAAGRVVYMNEAGARLMGAETPEQLIGVSILNLVHPDYRRTALERVRQAGKTGVRLELVEEKLVTLDGRVIDAEVTAMPITYGGMPALQVIVRDVTDRKRAEERLRESERRFRATFDSAPVGISHTGLDGRWQTYNRRLVEMLGYSDSEMGSLRWQDVTHPDDIADDETCLGRLLAGEVSTYTMEKRYVRKDGSLFWANLQVSLVRDDAGEPEYFVALVEDITERKRADAALRESGERFRAIFDGSGVGIFLREFDGRMVMTNQAYADLTGYSRDELLEMPFSAYTHPEDAAEQQRLIDEMVAGKRSQFQLEKRYRRRDGREVWARLTVHPALDSDGRPQYVAGVVEDITEHKRVQQELEHNALHDGLTDLPNRRLLRDRLEQAILATRRLRGREHLALLFMDLDRFKEVNDSFGHHSGDELLKQLAHRLRGALRESDTVARLGGDEFAILLPDSDAVGAQHVAAGILRALEAPFVVEGHNLDVGASIGIALYPFHGEDAPTLMRRADVAMYGSKRNASGYLIYTEDQDCTNPDRLVLARDLRLAIEAGALTLHYQPQVRVGARSCNHVEALVRWNHPVRGCVPPADFIPLAEETHLIRPLTLWVLDEALRQMREWRQGGFDACVSVNLSPRTLHDTCLIDTVAESLRRWQIPASALRLEITEGAIALDPARSLVTVNELARLGVGLSIDDFGTGYSSLALLRQLPVSEVKIDRGFVLDLPSDSDGASIVRSVIDLGHHLGLQVVAEGVETAEALRWLGSHGCDLAQGYFLSRPLPAAECLEWVRNLSRARELRTA